MDGSILSSNLFQQVCSTIRNAKFAEKRWVNISNALNQSVCQEQLLLSLINRYRQGQKNWLVEYAIYKWQNKRQCLWDANTPFVKFACQTTFNSKLPMEKCRKWFVPFKNVKERYLWNSSRSMWCPRTYTRNTSNSAIEKKFTEILTLKVALPQTAKAF
jgi:hypothetical protein